MPSLPPFQQSGYWFKGNLHTHTSRSDGKLSLAENVQWHADHGYDFVAITDHDTLPDLREVSIPRSLLVVPGAEISARRGATEYHILAIGIDQMPSPGTEAQDVIDAVTAAGGLCFIAHPYWHDHSFDDMLGLKGYTGIEIFNAGCWLEINKGHALVHWDGILRRGRQVWGIAADDSHFHYPDHGYGWVVVRAETLDVPAILQALRLGQFYSTTGPEIYDLRLEGREVTVSCSPARSVFLIGDLWHCPNAIHAGDDGPITEAKFVLHPEQRYLRVEVVDPAHRSAWTNAYLVPHGEVKWS